MLVMAGCCPSEPEAPAPASESPTPVPDSQSLAPFDLFVDSSYVELAQEDPDTLWAVGRAVLYGVEDLSSWTQVTEDAFAERAALAQEILGQLQEYDVELLTKDQRITYDAYLWLLEDLVRGADYRGLDYAIGMSSYGFHNLALDLMGGLPIHGAEDAAAYVERIRNIDAWMEQVIDVCRAREAKGILPTDFAIDMTLMELDMIIPPEGDVDPEGLGAYASFVARLNELASVSPEEIERLEAEAREAIVSDLVPVFRAFREYVASLAGRGGVVGVSEHEDAADYYEYLLSHHITKPMTAEEVYAVGEREVGRLQGEMQTFAVEVLGWPAGMSMAELEARIVEENQPVLQGEELLAEYQGYVDEVDELLDGFFNTKPESDLVIVVDTEGAPCYYVEPPIDKSEPGKVMTSLVNVVPFMPYDEAVLMHHEGIPGHHFQYALARDLDLPDFQRDLLTNYYVRHPLFQAYTEGWALYAERLAAEMGVYEDDPLGQLCQKRLELARLVRLVTDVGLNALGWTWEQAQTYSLEATGRSEARTRQLHYDGYPGQVTIGMGYVLFMELRQHAMDELGDAFDIKEFHDTILLHGPVPFRTLEWIVEEWIGEKKAS